MKTLIQITLAVLVVVACARGGEATWRFYELKDAIEQEIRYGNATTTSQLHQRVMELAVEHGVTLNEEDLVVESRHGDVLVSGHYVEPIVVVPAIYTRQQQFTLEVNVRAVRPLVQR